MLKTAKIVINLTQKNISETKLQRAACKRNN